MSGPPVLAAVKVGLGEEVAVVAAITVEAIVVRDGRADVGDSGGRRGGDVTRGSGGAEAAAVGGGVRVEVGDGAGGAGGGGGGAGRGSRGGGGGRRGVGVGLDVDEEFRCPDERRD